MAAKITVKNNGSIRVEGDFELLDLSGKKFNLNGRSTISMCRCGASKDKPFCDGSHRVTGFQSEITARELPPIAEKS
jgi:CDGSH-type Zn-finger protein